MVNACYFILTINFVGCSGLLRKPNDTMRLIISTVVGVVLGFLIGISFPTVSLTKVWISLVQFLVCLFLAVLVFYHLFIYVDGKYLFIILS